ncbi:MAG: hypothetical protein E4H10_10445 [Bacteroidia bacterium]|nr:MAG: hypothetical protein E4H10_10445 [Bacteroidia bacterium]
MFLKILIIAIVLISLSMMGMMLNILVKKKGRFPEYRVGHNRAMRQKGISCVKHDEIHCHNKRLKESQGCSGC